MGRGKRRRIGGIKRVEEFINEFVAVRAEGFFEGRGESGDGEGMVDDFFEESGGVREFGGEGGEELELIGGGEKAGELEERGGVAGVVEFGEEWGGVEAEGGVVEELGAEVMEVGVVGGGEGGEGLESIGGGDGGIEGAGGELGEILGVEEEAVEGGEIALDRGIGDEGE